MVATTTQPWLINPTFAQPQPTLANVCHILRPGHARFAPATPALSTAFDPWLNSNSQARRQLISWPLARSLPLAGSP
jgi:hypothetical protein